MPRSAAHAIRRLRGIEIREGLNREIREERFFFNREFREAREEENFLSLISLISPDLPVTSLFP